MGKPTKSRALYSQSVGRATRPLPGLVDSLATADERKAAIAASDKPACLIVDFCGNAGRHKLMSSADILGGNVSDEAMEEAVAAARAAGKPVRMSEVLDQMELKLRAAKETRRKEEEERQRRDAERRQHVKAKANFTVTAINAFDVFQIRPAASRGWDKGKVLSEPQRAMLRDKMGIDPDSVTYSEGDQLIKEQFRRWRNKLCTFKQAKWLKKHHYSVEMPMAEANKIMTAWEKNGWQRPKEEVSAGQAARLAVAGKDDEPPF
jgi:hypothetical protein